MYPEFSSYSNTGSRPNINKLIQKLQTTFSNGQQSKLGAWKEDSIKSCKNCESNDEDFRLDNSLELVESIKRKKKPAIVKSKGDFTY